MKKLLGSIVLFLTINSFATPLYEYNVSISNLNPYLKEQLKLTITIKQKDKSKVMFFNLKPQKNPSFELKLLGQDTINKGYHNNTSIFRYRLYPLKDANQSLQFNLTISQASDTSVEKFYTGDRDGLKSMSTIKTTNQLKPINFDIKPLLQPVDMIGDFKLTFWHDNELIMPYQQLNATYSLKGVGYKNTTLKKLPPIKNVETFFLPSYDKKTATTTHKYAFVSDKNFTIPPLSINCFSPKKNLYYTLSIPKTSIQVQKRDISTLIDKTDNFPTKETISKELNTYFRYIAIFILGFIFAKINFKRLFKTKTKSTNILHSKIKKASTNKQLLKLLLTKSDEKFAPFIKKLETSIYKDKNISLKELKDELLKL